MYLIIMIYITCPTCGFFIGSKIEEYENKKKEICSKYDDENIRGEEIQKVIKNLKLRRYCCRMRIMTAKDVVDDILPVSDE